MKLTVLTENVAGRKCLAEFGLSYFIEADKKILFDAGNSDVFLRNANRLKIKLEETDMVVLSHGHWDHGNGLAYFGGKPLLTHPVSFSRRFNKKDNSYVGLDVSSEQLAEKYTITTSKEPVALSPEVFFLGEIPRRNDFESKSTHFVFENGEEDFVPDDSGIAVITGHGLVVITGCAHSGVCNTIDYACEVTGVDSVYAVIGGFHLKNDADITRKTIEFIKTKGIKRVYPSHCTAFPALAAFSREFRFFQVLTGDFFYF